MSRDELSEENVYFIPHQMNLCLYVGVHKRTDNTLKMSCNALNSTLKCKEYQQGRLYERKE
jgi:hypothetical protein